MYNLLQQELGSFPLVCTFKGKAFNSRAFVLALISKNLKSNLGEGLTQVCTCTYIKILDFHLRFISEIAFKFEYLLALESQGNKINFLILGKRFTSEFTQV